MISMSLYNSAHIFCSIIQRWCRKSDMIHTAHRDVFPKCFRILHQEYIISKPCSNKISTAEISARLEERDVLQTNALME